MVCHHIHCMLISQAWMVLAFGNSSAYIAGGLDGNVDLTGITDSGYTDTNKPETDTPATDAGEEIEKHQVLMLKSWRYGQSEI